MTRQIPISLQSNLDGNVQYLTRPRMMPETKKANQKIGLSHCLFVHHFVHCRRKK